MCVKLISENLKPTPYPSNPIIIYICKVTIALTVRVGKIELIIIQIKWGIYNPYYWSVIDYQTIYSLTV